MPKVKITMYADVESIDAVKDMEHHMDYYIDFDNNPHLKSVYGVTVEEYKEIAFFYFTFGSCANFPYQNGFLAVRAKSRPEAIELFREKYPDITEGVVNCAAMYTQEEWDKLTFKPRTPHEIISREGGV